MNSDERAGWFKARFHLNVGRRRNRGTEPGLFTNEYDEAGDLVDLEPHDCGSTRAVPMSYGLGCRRCGQLRAA